LPEGSALIEFVHLVPRDFGAVPAQGESVAKAARYLAFVLPAGEPDAVEMIDLGEARFIDFEIAFFTVSITGQTERGSAGGVEDASSIQPSGIDDRSERAALRSAIVAARHSRPKSPPTEPLDSASSGSRLREALFDPLTSALAERRRLFLAPAGNLATLPFESLPLADGRHLIEEYEISYLAAGRDVLRFAASSALKPGPPLVAADPDFDLEATTTARTSSVAKPFERLSGTRREGERVAEMLGVTPLLEAAALEARIKGNRLPRILHLATHGFFLNAVQRDPLVRVDPKTVAINPDALFEQEQGGSEPVGRPRNGDLAQLEWAENPLLRSGLALAGANTWLEEGTLPEEAEDGLLTAEDVTGMDLLATDLVILSACQTGLGDVHAWEGVYGLRRAFVLAGAKTLVMSLWNVPDEQTQELMEDFYQRLLQGQPRAEALRGAQLAMKAKCPDPYYWGAFICQGDPAPLSQHNAEG